MKQHLNIKTFHGNSENAVKTQIWIAVCVYALVAIAKKTLSIDASLYTFLQVLGITVFEKALFRWCFRALPPKRAKAVPLTN